MTGGWCQLETREKVLEELNQSLPSYVSEKIKYASDASFSNDHSQLNLTYLTEEFVETTTTIMLNQSYDPT